MDLNIKLIQETFELVTPRAEEFANRFYANLFQDYPAAQPLFDASQLDKQKRLLVASLVQVVHNLENPEFLGEYLGRMGERHHTYGATEEHFEWVGLTLLKTLKDMFGDAWTREINHQWAMAFDVIAALMNEGMNRAKTKVVPLRKAEVEKEPATPFRITLPREVTEQLDQLARKYVQQAVQDYFEQATQKELKQVLGPGVQDILKKVS
ncbi:MAG TPA: globin domain-containing protein [Oligoflexus sp.]|uniref:globin domain-containing protein n=1 Tax=Oligoflexus sp. TaxID=1971216 RepID=UPI002D7FC309|nr:globin domain-containing protein [Oligoflexus sp.]HET9238337.1 globin domain-containing protein [Oligoflexus sp.]